MPAAKGSARTPLGPISASADGGPRSRVCARLTLHSAPHRHQRILSALSLSTQCERIESGPYIRQKTTLHFGPSGVRALPLAAGINEGGHYFRYFSSWYILRRQAYISCAEYCYRRYSKPQKGSWFFFASGRALYVVCHFFIISMTFFNAVPYIHNWLWKL